MSDLDALLAGIVADPTNHLRWLVMADWLEEFDDPARAELLRLHRMMLGTCLEPDAPLDRYEWQARIVELIDLGAKPCVPRHTLLLPGGVPLVGNFIPPGSFLMGSELEVNEQPIREVTIAEGFWMGIHPVTQAQWRAVMETDPSNFKGDNRPVESVSWEDATEFCEKVARHTRCAVRLPSEAEWEYACRAGTDTHFHYGNVDSSFRINYRGSTLHFRQGTRAFRNQTVDVASFPPNPWGLFDCHGNVAEWCRDRIGPDADSPPDNPDYEEGIVEYVERVSRGGGWQSEPSACRSAARRMQPYSGPDIGFRVVFTPG